MLVSAKSKYLQAGEIGRKPGSNGVIAVCTAKDRSLSSWVSTSLCFDVGAAEAEVPCIYRSTDGRTYILTFSSQRPDDYLRRISRDGVPQAQGHEEGVFYKATISAQELHKLLSDPPQKPVKLRVERIPYKGAATYANRLLPGRSACLGFDLASGNPALRKCASADIVTPPPADFAGFEL